MCCRLGEATNPGPCEPIIGCFNPTGILGKTPSLSQPPVSGKQTAWAISETHLSRQGKSKLSVELKAHKTGLYAQMGSDVPARSASISAVAGKHRGVGFLSTAPRRAMTTNWSPDLHQANRIHAACFQMGPRPVMGGVIYGYPVNPESTETQQATDELCQALSATLVYPQTGLRFIAGDFNQHDQALASMQEWTSRGWVNAQKWAFDKHGIDIKVTCKGATTKDHLFLSPELAAYLSSVHVEDDWFADHAILYAKFTSFGSPPKVPLWRQPAALPWDKCPPLATPPKPFVLPSAEPSNQLEAICKEMETRVQAALESAGHQVHRQEMGRAATREVRMVQEYAHPPKTGRQGEFQSEFLGANLMHAQLMRQARRPVSYQRATQVLDPGPTHAEYICSVWRKILKAQGFAMPFQTWWASLGNKIVPTLPQHPPKGPELNEIVEVVQRHLRSFETSLMRDRVHQAKQRRLNDANAVFRDLQREPNAQVQVLLEDVKARIIAVDPDQLAVEFDEPTPWKPNVPFTCRNAQFDPLHVEPDKIWVDNLDHFKVGDVVRQEETVGNLSALFSLFSKEWQQRWDRHANVPEDDWEPICQFADTALPLVPDMEYQPISYDTWVASLRRKSTRAATGPDALSRADLLNMPRDLTEALLAIFHDIERYGVWPEQLLTGFVVALEKQPNAKYVQQFRPITVFPVAYRNYTSIRARQILQFLDPHVPATRTGNLPHRHAGQMRRSLMDQIEIGLHQGSQLSGGVIDLIKAFNTLPRLPIMHVMKRLKIPVQILRAWSSATIHMTRRFKIHNAVGPPERSSTGYAEGCAQFADEQGLPCDVLHAPVQEIRARLSEAWQHRIQTEHSKRPSMTGLQRANAAMTVQSMRLLSPEDQAILQTCLNGAFYTADKYYAQGKLDSPNCKFCGQTDSQDHRHWQCPHFAQCRKLSNESLATMSQLDPCLRSHGWIPEPPNLQAFRKLLLQLPHAWDTFQWPPVLPPAMHLFTDGGCQEPQCQWGRLATWGIALGQFEDQQPWPLASGIVSGWCQSSLRAEICAVIAACNAGLLSRRPIVLWIDNDLVYRRVKAMTHRPCWIKPNQKDADLWTIVRHLVQQLGPHLQTVCKVVSHQDSQGARNEAERWIFAGNDAADALATAAADKNPTLQATWTALCRDIADVTTLRKFVHSTLIAVGRHAIFSRTQLEQPDTPRVPRLTQADVPEFLLPDLDSTAIATKYHFDGMQTVLNWTKTLVDPSETTRLVSWFQLNALFEHQTSLTGLDLTKQKQWRLLPHRSKLNFVQRTNKLSKWLQGAINDAGGQCRPKHLRPQSQTVQFWTQCLMLRIPSGLLQLADDLLCAHQPHYRSVQALRSI